ncbi:MAG: sulfatase-like hydrolase/transferase [Akkermansiaceae bacterium]|nr:sulfatase-like hydrolase/transferase [Akkermansiaceae bacterium]
MRPFRTILLLTALAVPPSAPAAEKPNVIVILADDLGWADLGAQKQAPDVKTPHLDDLAASGVRCSSGYITSPQCSPSRAAIITGRHQQRFGIDTIPDVPLPAEAVTLAERLGPAGYRCGFVGKWHLEPNILCTRWFQKKLPEMVGLPPQKRRIPPAKMQPHTPGAQGFHEYFWGEMNHYRANFARDGKDLPPGRRVLQFPGEFRVDIQTEAATAFIDRNHDRPFYLHVGYYAPHTPLEATKKYLDRFTGPMPERRRYALAMIAAIDDGVGKIMDRLKTHGLLENTLVIFTSDNGAPLKLTRPDSPVDTDPGGWDGSINDPWKGEKGMLSEGGIRVPMLFSWKGNLPAGTVYQKPVSSLDFAATAVSLAGLPASPELDGVDLLPHLKGSNDAAPHPSLCWRFWNQAAIRAGKWKFLSAAEGGEFLFDLETDGGETKNRIAEEPRVADDLRDRLARWTRDFDPPGIPQGKLNDQETRWYEHYFSVPEKP